MNAPTTIKRPESLVRQCSECEGTGEVSNGRGRGGNDPDSWNVDCDECGGTGYFPCEACGNPFDMKGHDCFVCETVGALPLGFELSPANAEILHRALGEALHRAAESYAPAGGVA